MHRAGVLRQRPLSEPALTRRCSAPERVRPGVQLPTRRAGRKPDRVASVPSTRSSHDAQALRAVASVGTSRTVRKALALPAAPSARCSRPPLPFPAPHRPRENETLWRQLRQKGMSFLLGTEKNAEPTLHSKGVCCPSPVARTPRPGPPSRHLGLHFPEASAAPEGQARPLSAHTER